MDPIPFRDVVTSEEALRALVGRPSELAIRKEISHLDAHCRAFIARSPFVLIATSGASGRATSRPRAIRPASCRCWTSTASSSRIGRATGVSTACATSSRTRTSGSSS